MADAEGSKMGTLKWYARDPARALAGMMKMTLAEAGAYNKILDLIYLREGKLLDDPAEICRWLNCKPRVWKRIRAKLIDMEKLYVHAGCLHNERADEEIVKSRRIVEKSIQGATLRWARYNEIKRLRDAPPMQHTYTKKESLSAKIVPITKEGLARKIEDKK
jgi:uncharacterized protein YdaU (DUF1376 family)